MSRGGYIVVGIIAALILVPTSVAAAAIAYTGIEGTNGATTTVNDAHVTSAGQLLTTEANPSTFVQTIDIDLVSPSTPTLIAEPKTNDALIVTTIHYDVYADPSPELVKTWSCTSARDRPAPVAKLARFITTSILGPTEKLTYRSPPAL